MGLIIVQPIKKDFHCIASLHAESITEGFLSTLGLNFLANLYSGISAAPRSGVLVASDKGAVVGFAAYTADLSACYRWVLTHRFLRIAWALLPSLFNFSMHRKILETLAYPRRTSMGSHPTESSPQPRAELLAIAVSQRARGHGVGKQLLCAVDDRLKAWQISKYIVVTHGVDARSNGFYSGCGFHLVRSFTNHGKPMNEYMRLLMPVRIEVVDASSAR